MVWAYTCKQCGLVTRVEEGQNHEACMCKAGYDVVDENPPPVEPPPQDGP